jgi:myo-inositol-1(or 4)-monophosphatase
MEGMMTPTPHELLDAAVAAARAGGAVLMEGLQRPRQVELKSERTSIVTWADVTAQQEILRVIAERFPGHAVLAEEDQGRGEVAHGPVTWLVDPLDGTSNYAHGIPFACTSVAARDADGLAAGAIIDPFRGELFTAARGGGAWLSDDRQGFRPGASANGAESVSTRLTVSAADSLSQALVCTGLQSDDPDAIASFGRRIVALSSHCRGVRCVGSPALCLAYVAAGRVDAFVERDATYAWDVGAGALLIVEAGGRIEDLDGGPVNLGPGLANVLASNGRIHAALGHVIRAAERMVG